MLCSPPAQEGGSWSCGCAAARAVLVPESSSPSAGAGWERHPSSAPAAHPPHLVLCSAHAAVPLLGPRSCRGAPPPAPCPAFPRWALSWRWVSPCTSVCAACGQARQKQGWGFAAGKHVSGSAPITAVRPRWALSGGSVCVCCGSAVQGRSSPPELPS